MRKILAIVLFGIIQINHAVAINPTATIEWTETSIDFGEIPYGEPVTAEFIFKNPGMIPLIISDVKPSCGCTVANFPKQPVISGKEEKIEVTFDGKSEGYFSKTISVYSNTEDGITKLYVKGTVMK